MTHQIVGAVARDHAVAGRTGQRASREMPCAKREVFQIGAFDHVVGGAELGQLDHANL